MDYGSESVDEDESFVSIAVIFVIKTKYKSTILKLAHACLA